MPTHYSFQVGSRLDRLRQRYRHMEQLTPTELAKLHADEAGPADAQVTPAIEAGVRTVISDLDQRGAWVEVGRLRYHGDDNTRRIIDSGTFARNIDILSRYLAAVRSAR